MLTFAIHLLLSLTTCQPDQTAHEVCGVQVRIHLVMDSCHSGSVADLEYISHVKGGQPHWSQEYRRRPSVYKGTAGGRCFHYSLGWHHPRPEHCFHTGPGLWAC